MTALVREDDNKKFYAQIRAVLGAEKASESVLETAIAYCGAAGLDIMKKPVAIISYGGKDQIVFTIQAITTIASRSGWAGNDEIVYGGKCVVDGAEYPEWGYQVVYKMVQGHRCPFTGPKVYFKERYKPGWKMAGYMTMFNKCILAASLRTAFPEALAHAYEEEEIKYEPIVNVDRSGVEALTKKVDDSTKGEVIEVQEVPADTYDDMLSLIMEASTEAELRQAGEAIKSFGEMPDHLRTNLLEAFNNKKKELK